MACELCRNIREIEDQEQPHTVRVCKGCGRKVHTIERGDQGIGIRICAGDQFVIPAGWLKIHPDPLKGTTHLTRAGLEWFAKRIFLQDLPREYQDIEKVISANDAIAVQILKSSELLAGLDWENDDHSEAIFQKLLDNQETVEWWAYMFGLFSSFVQEAIKEANAVKAAWAATCAERYRSMLVFKQELEQVVWMGHSARRLVEMLKVWDGHRLNSDEGFWQIQFNENAYVLSQAFSLPVFFMQDRAYVGGMGIDRRNAKFVDYLYSGATANEAVLIEIKTPTAKLLGTKYRSIYRPSPELSGALVQLSDYRVALIANIDAISKSCGKNLSVLSPKCLIVVGNREVELDSEVKRHSFELFRNSLNSIEIVTYDELFKKVEALATIFNLVRKKT